mmetsp:Transcript_15737/g.33288  ORF Transcript_15737/g.33288 Transcript_15737/m.33288 type:complete len:81 (-) Transcript_15737:239-481(-)
MLEVPTDTEAWFLNNDAQNISFCGTTKALTKKQMQLVNFCGDFPDGETYNAKAPRASTNWMIGTGDTGRGNCGNDPNPGP